MTKSLCGLVIMCAYSLDLWFHASAASAFHGGHEMIRWCSTHIREMAYWISCKFTECVIMKHDQTMVNCSCACVVMYLTGSRLCKKWQSNGIFSLLKQKKSSTVRLKEGNTLLKGNLLDLEPCWLLFKHPMTDICFQSTTRHHAQKLMHLSLRVDSLGRPDHGGPLRYFPCCNKCLIGV